MYKVLCLEEDSFFRDYISMILESSFDVNVLDSASLEQGLELLKSGTEIDFIISCLGPKSDAIDEAFEFIKTNKLDISFVCITERVYPGDKYLEQILSYSQKNFYIKKPFQDVDFFPVIDKVLLTLKSKKNSTPTDQLIPAQYCKIKTRRFLSFNISDVDVFIKLKNGKFIKVIKAQDEYDVKRIENYINHEEQHLYIYKENFNLFHNRFRNLVLAHFNKQNLSTHQGASLQLVSLNHIHEVVFEMGVSEAIKEQTDLTIRSITQTFKQDKDLSKILDSIIKGKDFTSEHSLLLSYVALEIAQNTDMRSDMTTHKLTLASLLHDVGFDDSVLCDKYEYSKLTEINDERSVLEKVKAHPLRSAEIVSKSPFMIPDVDSIIAQHHERPSGLGYPRGLSDLKIAPLTCIFILAEEYVKRVFQAKRSGKKFEMEVAANEIKEQFGKGNFRKPLEGFLKSFAK